MYALCSSQHVNPLKSVMYVVSMSSQKLSTLAQTLGFQEGQLPFTYLGVPIFKGKPKVHYFQPIVDKVKAKLSNWKASLLTMDGRVQVIKSVVHNMLIYSLLICSWSIRLVKDLEICMRNFMWNKDISKRKLIIVAWHKVCKPLVEGGLGMRSLSKINDASNLKLFLDLFNSSNQWLSRSDAEF